MELIETRDYVDGFPASVVAVENSSDILIPYPFNVMVFSPWKLYVLFLSQCSDIS